MDFHMCPVFFQWIFPIFLPTQRLVNPFQRRRAGSIHAFPASQAASSKWLYSILLVFLRTWLVWSGDLSNRVNRKKIERWNITKIVSTDMLDLFGGCNTPQEDGSVDAAICQSIMQKTDKQRRIVKTWFMGCPGFDHGRVRSRHPNLAQAPKVFSVEISCSFDWGRKKQPLAATALAMGQAAARMGMGQAEDRAAHQMTKAPQPDYHTKWIFINSLFLWLSMVIQ